MARRTKGEGSLYQAADKSWVFQYRVDGQRKTKRFKKKAGAKAFQEALTAQIAGLLQRAPAKRKRQGAGRTVPQDADQYTKPPAFGFGTGGSK